MPDECALRSARRLCVTTSQSYKGSGVRAGKAGDPHAASAAADVLQDCASSPALACAVRRLLQSQGPPSQHPQNPTETAQNPSSFQRWNPADAEALATPASPRRPGNTAETNAAPSETLPSGLASPAPSFAGPQPLALLQAVLPALLRTFSPAGPGAPVGTSAGISQAGPRADAGDAGPSCGTGRDRQGHGKAAAQVTEVSHDGGPLGTPGAVHFLRKVLTVPRLVAGLGPAQRKLLASEAVLRPCLAAVAGAVQFRVRYTSWY